MATFLLGWSGLLSKKNLELAGKKMKEMCSQCSLNIGSCDTPGILSACLVSLESLTSFHIMADAVKIEEKMSSNCPLQTPRDASTTHILVFPTSAIAQVNSLDLAKYASNNGFNKPTVLCIKVLLLSKEIFLRWKMGMFYYWLTSWFGILCDQYPNIVG